MRYYFIRQYLVLLIPLKYHDRIHEHETKEIFKHANKFAFFLMCCFNLLNASLFVTNSDYICSPESDSFFSFYHFDDRVLCTISVLVLLYDLLKFAKVYCKESLLSALLCIQYFFTVQRT